MEILIRVFWMKEIMASFLLKNSVKIHCVIEGFVYLFND